MKIRNKINLTFFILFIAVTLSTGMTIGILSTKSLKTQGYEHVKSVNRTKAEHVRTFLNSEKEVVGILAASTLLRDFIQQKPGGKQYQAEKDRVATRFKRSIEEVSQIYELFLINQAGEIVVSTDKTKEGLIKKRDDYFTKAQHNIFIKDLYNSDTTKQLDYTVSAPIKDDLTGVTVGVVVARMNPNNLFKIVADNSSLMETGENFLVNNQKFLISPSRFYGNEAILNKKIETQNVKNCFDQEKIFLIKKENYSNASEIQVDYVDHRGKTVIGTHSYIPEANWCLVTKIDETDIIAPARELMISFVFLSLIFLFIFPISGLIVSRKITESLDALRKGAKIIENGNLKYNIDIKSKDEVGELARSFNSMVLGIKKSRAEVDEKVEKQTKEIQLKAANIEKQKQALINILNDVEQEKSRAETLANIVLSAEESIISEDLNGIIMTWNKGAEKLYGYKAEEVIGKSIKIIFPKDRQSELDSIVKTTLNNNRIDHYQTQRLKKDGTIIDVSLSISPIKNHEEKITGFSAISFDISKEKQIDRAKTEFVSLASHQLRTPLSSINWYAEMLLAGDAGKLNEEQLGFIKEIYAGNQRMVELVNSLLNVSRLELGTFVVDPEPTDIAKSAEIIINELKPGLETKKIKFSFKADKKLPIIEADPKLLRIIFQNLLSNAIKYTPEKGKIDLTIAKNGENLAITVTDNGYGITKKQQGRIFEKLFRADNVKEKDTEGTGLGLYIVKAIIDQAGGKIWFESEENKGSSFFVEMPLTGMKKKEGTKAIE